MDTEKLAENIKKTGFFLEYQVCSQLREQGWSVITNRYYVDDQSESVREIDLVAYKTRSVQGFLVYTVLLISCKKSEENLWALLARDLDLTDPNADWQPVHVWTNELAIQYMIAQEGWRDDYFEHISAGSADAALSPPEVEVFAFQEMKKSSGAVRNDRPIFDSITSLMKAQAYELSCLPSRKKEGSVYQFNLVSVAGSDLVRLHFHANGEVEATPVDSERYVANYIVNQERTSAGIRFVRASAFPAVLDDYAQLHDANCEFFDGLCDSFYADAVKDRRKAAVFIGTFRERIEWPLCCAVRNAPEETDDPGDVSLWYDKEDELLAVLVELPEATVAALNKNASLNKATREALTELYRYEGCFSFRVNPFPF